MKLLRLKPYAPTLLMLAGICAWLWPLGVGGRMPVGGDVTSFQIGLMAEYQRALHGWRLPLWNANWGFGFPGLAESQMGVYYPPHVVLYALLPLEAAYTASLVLHTLWAALGTLWCARRLGISSVAAALAGFVWATCGFFVIHITHQWGYTAGSWMPWAWGLTWTIVRGQRTRRTWLALAAVLAIQVLPGHFQLAFITQTTVLLIAVWSLIDAAIARLFNRKSSEPGQTRAKRWALLLVVFAWMGAGFLAACQLRPTWDLARRAEQSRDWDYLAGFAQTPVHLVSYVAPGLFHRSPLWRPVAWDPFHTSPEENLGYVGLVPLWLALAAAWRLWGRDSAVRMLACVALVTLALSFGPYVPGFDWLIRLPGFSFFRAPARWGAATMLALALLGAKGLDDVTNWGPLRGSVLRFAALALLWPLLLIGAFELALASTNGRGMPDVANAFERARALVPWQQGPTFRDVMAEARQPATNPISLSALARRGIDPRSRLDHMRGSVYVDELWMTAAVALALLGVALVLAGRKQMATDANPLAEPVAPEETKPAIRLRTALITLTAFDLLVTGFLLRDVDNGPIRSLVEQSPVLQRLAQEAKTTRGRVVSGLGNLPMVAGAANVPAYRTLDIPVAQGLQESARTRVYDWPLLQYAFGVMRACGASVRVFAPNGDWIIEDKDAESLVDVVRDQALARWFYGHSTGVRNDLFRVLSEIDQPVELKGVAFKWIHPVLLPERAPYGFRTTGKSQPIWSSPVPEHVRLSNVRCVQREQNRPCRLVLMQTPDPEWSAFWVSPSGRVPAEMVSSRFSVLTEGYWPEIIVPDGEVRTLELRYEGRAAKAGLAASALAWGAWALLWFAPWRWNAQRKRGQSPAAAHAIND